MIEADDNFLWLGEAKIHSTYDWLFKGFQQLDTRYSTGLPGQNTGGIIIYCTGANIPAVMDKWMEFLVSKRPDVTAKVCHENPFVRRSEHKHAATQQLSFVRHVAFNLHFNPQDRAS